ncbi:MAG: hypothetical protein HYS63_09670 [Methylocystis sp.]|nr:hypothetical protein [Methylocystis sp.]
MQRLVSLATVAASLSTVLILLRLPLNVARRIAASPEAFIDAIERFAKR